MSPFRSLFRLFRSRRAASPESLDAFFFSSAFPRQSKRNSHRMVAALVDDGYLARMRLPHARLIYHLTRRSLSTLTDAGIEVPETLRRPPTIEVGGYLWLRSSMRAELVRQGFTVGRGPREVNALRRFLLDSDKRLHPDVAAAIRADAALAPLTRARCRRCQHLQRSAGACAKCRGDAHFVVLSTAYKCETCGTVAEDGGPHAGRHRECLHPMRELDCLPLDVAWRERDGRYDVRLLFVEHPARGLATQLDELPLKHPGAPKVPIILRSTDPDSRFDRQSNSWVAKGPRHQQLERAFGAEGPFATTATVVDVRTELQLHIMRSQALPPKWDCGGDAWRAGGKRGREHEREHERGRAERGREREPAREHVKVEHVRARGR